MGDAGDREKQAPTPAEERSHVLHVFTGRVSARLDELGSVLTATMTETERGETLAELTRIVDRLEAMASTLVADDPGAVNQLRARTKVTGRTTRRLVRRSRALEAYPAVQAAVASGEVHLDQAEVIIGVLDKLPTEVAHLAREAEEHLLGLALEHDAEALKNLAKHLLHVIAPDQADELLARELEREEREARRTAYLKMFRDGQGSVHGKFKLPELHGHLLEALLGAIANPQRPDAIDRENRDLPEVKGQALCELLERINVTDLPQTGGSSVSVVVTMSLDTLTGGLKVAGILGTDLQLSPSEARRLAAKHGVIPGVLGGRSQVLDLGRKRRLATRAQRLAKAIEQDGLCNRAGCTVPAAWCDANHRTPWIDGGRTDLKDLELLCPRDHTDHHHGINYPRRT